MGLLDALIALAILSFGMLAMSRFQARLVASSTEAQARLTATELADELLNTAIVDKLNATCYTVPAAGACASTTASARTAAWLNRVQTTLPEAAASSVLSAANQIAVTVQWRGKVADATQASGDVHRVEVTSDVVVP